jgi:hypothetical protein
MTDNPWNTVEAIVRPSWLTNEIETLLEAKGFPLSTDGMLMLWKETKERLSNFKEIEMDYRKICAAFLVPDKVEGTTNVELGLGYVAKVVTKYNYNLNSDNDKIWSALSDIESVGNEGKFIAERLVSWTPNFLKTEYTTLQEASAKGSDSAKVILKIINDKMLTITEGAPTLEIKEPKAKR